MPALVLSTHRLHPAAETMLRDVAELRVASALDPTTLSREAAEADILIVRAPVPAALFDAAPRLRAAIRHGAGVDMIPLEAATAAGVLVANLPGSNAQSVAEYVLMTVLMLLRRFRAIDADLRQDGWLAGRAHADATAELGGRRLGLVGFGAVGRAIAAIASDGFGLTIMATTRRPRDLGPGIEATDLDTLLAQSDIVVLALPLDRETRGLIDRRRLGLMREGAFLVNVARGPVVEEAGLVEALRSGRLAGAALDVFAEQPLPKDHPFLDLPNLILTPHLAGITGDSMARMGRGAAEEARRILAGDLPRNFVNPEALPAYRRRFPGQ